MKRLILVFGLIFFTQVVFTQSLSAPEFDGIPIAGNAKDCIAKFKAKGYEFEYSEGNFSKLHGVIGNNVVKIYVGASPISKQVWVCRVYFPKNGSWSLLKEKYVTLKNSLVKRYGDPLIAFESFSPPYDGEDADKMLAVLEGKCEYIALWGNTPKNYCISVEISNTKEVMIAYENLKNSEIAKKESDQIISDKL
jgi:hypothetical protein